MFAILALHLITTGCGQEATTAQALGLDALAPTTAGGASGTDVAGETIINVAADASDDSGVYPYHPGGDATGKGDETASGAAGDVPTLDVSTEALDFGPAGARRTFQACNWSTAALNFTAASDVSWATVSPSSGTLAGDCQTIVVTVDRASLAQGDHTGTVTVSSADGLVREVTLWLHVPGPPLVELSSATLDFGFDDATRSFSVRNAGEGTLSFNVTPSVDWVTVWPEQGEVTSQASMIEVTINRVPLVTGPHEAWLTISTEEGPQAEVAVLAGKPVTTPLLVPWIECNDEHPERTSITIEGLRVWRRVTDTAIVSTSPGHANLYTLLRQQVPGMHIIPGIKTEPLLGYVEFDQLDKWQIIAQEVAAMAATSGEQRIIFEHENALQGYMQGTYEIDFDRLAQCLASLPPDLQYLWYPAYTGESAAARERAIPLLEAVENALNVRLIALGLSSPASWEYGWSVEGRAIIRELSARPGMPIVYFGCFSTGYCYWDPADVDQVMQYATESGYPEIIPYPGMTHWVDRAQQIVDALSQ